MCVGRPEQQPCTSTRAEGCDQFLFFVLTDAEFKETIKNALSKLEVPMPAAMPCKIRRSKHGETCSSTGTRKPKYACIVETDESTRKRLEGTLQKDHEDHIAGKRINSLNHYNLVHKFIPMLKQRKYRKQKQQWTKNGKNSAWQRTKVRNKKEVIDDAKKESKTVHFASLVDTCHPKNSELEPKHQKYEGRVVLRGDIVKDDSGSYAIFTNLKVALRPSGVQLVKLRVMRMSIWCVRVGFGEFDRDGLMRLLTSDGAGLVLTLLMLGVTCLGFVGDGTHLFTRCIGSLLPCSVLLSGAEGGVCGT